MKRLLLLLACLLALCTGVCAAEPVISEMKTDCTLTGSSSCQVTQSFTLEISGAQTQLRFPLSAGAKKASVAGYQTQKQTDGDCPVLVLTDANGFTGTRSFTVMYTISGLASEADGVQTLHGCEVRACDLRAGAAMVIAGLAADRTTTIEDIEYIERGYENLIGKLTAIGAEIRRVSVPDGTAVPAAV